MENIDLQEKISKLLIWAKDNNIANNDIDRVFDMLKLGKRGERTETDPIQFPSFYLKDNNAKSWHNPSIYPWVKLLEDNFSVIKQEALSILEKNLMNVHPENDDLAGYGTWNTFFFYKNGEAFPDNHRRCPLTSSILAKIPGVDIAGRSYFSAMTPGIHIKPHCGPHNFKLRTHLGIITPKEAVIRVGNFIQPWAESKCIVFDDSFEHEVWNNSQTTRVVLIVDVWNPGLTEKEIMALEYIMPEFYKRTEVLA